MTARIKRLGLPWAIAWILGVFAGQIIAFQTGWGRDFAGIFVLWRFLIAIVLVIGLSALIDLVWKGGPARNNRSLVREFVDALIIGFFVGLAYAR